MRMGCKFECRTEARVCVCERGEKKWEDVRRGPKGLEKEKGRSEGGWGEGS